MAYKATPNFRDTYYENENDGYSASPLDTGFSGSGTLLTPSASCASGQPCGAWTPPQQRPRSALSSNRRNLQARAASAHGARSRRAAPHSGGRDPREGHGAAARLAQSPSAPRVTFADQAQAQEPRRRAARVNNLQNTHYGAPCARPTAAVPPSSDPYLMQDPSVFPVKQNWSDPYPEYDQYVQKTKDVRACPPRGAEPVNQWDEIPLCGNTYPDEAVPLTSVNRHNTVQMSQLLKAPLQPTRMQTARRQRNMLQDSCLRNDCPGEENQQYLEDVPSEELCIIEGESGLTKDKCRLFEERRLYESSYSICDKAILNNFEEVEQLIQDEGEDVSMALHLQNRWAPPQLKSSSISAGSLHKFSSQQKKSHPKQNDEYEDSDDEVSPEVAAAMMHSEEQGILMGAAPLRVYNALFSDDDKDLIAVTSAAPFHPQNVVVPASVDNLPYTASAEDLVALATAIQGNDPLPSNSAFADNIKQRGLYNTVMAQASRPYVTEPTDAPECPADASKMSLPPAGGGGMEYVLDPASAPDHYSRVQLRGSTRPDWFPGYFQALPSIDGITAVCRDPSTVVEEAWSTLQSTMA